MGTHQRSFERYHTIYGLLFPKSKGSRTTSTHKNKIAIISGTGKATATDFKFGQNIHRVHPNKSPLKCWRKWSVGV